MNLFKKIELWESKGLITPAQGIKIKDFENKAKNPALLYVLLFLATFCIGVGIISTIAANWDEITPIAKLAIDFTILALVAFGIWHSDKNNKSFVKEALIILYAILIMATIGLVAQIYHLKSNGYSAILFWSVMVAPMFYISKKSVLPIMWVPMFHYALCAWLRGWGGDRDILDIDSTGMFFDLNTIITFCGLIYLASKYFGNKAAHFTNAVVAWSVISLVLYIICIELSWVGDYWRIEGLVSMLLYRGLPMYIAPYSKSVFWILTLGLIYLSRKSNMLYIFVGVMLIALSNMPGLSPAVLTFAMIALLMAYAYRNNKPKLLNFAGALAAIRIYIVYIDLFGSLLATGMGLIISGLVLLVLIKLWHVASVRLNKNFKEKIREA